MPSAPTRSCETLFWSAWNQKLPPSRTRTRTRCPSLPLERLHPILRPVAAELPKPQIRSKAPTSFQLKFTIELLVPKYPTLSSQLSTEGSTRSWSLLTRTNPSAWQTSGQSRNRSRLKLGPKFHPKLMSQESLSATRLTKLSSSTTATTMTSKFWISSTPSRTGWTISWWGCGHRRSGSQHECKWQFE